MVEKSKTIMWNRWVLKVETQSKRNEMQMQIGTQCRYCIRPISDEKGSSEVPQTTTRDESWGTSPTTGHAWPWHTNFYFGISLVSQIFFSLLNILCLVLAMKMTVTIM